MKFTLVCEYGDEIKITHEFKNVMLSDTLEHMQDFLKGCGFVFDGVLDIVDENVEQQPQDFVVEFPESHNKSYKFEPDLDLDGKC